MFLTPPDSYETPPAGNYVGVLYRIIDWGTQKSELGEKREVALCFELSDELMSTGKPFSVTKIYNQSLNKKATLRQHLECLGIGISTGKSFDLCSLLGRAAMVNVIHVEREGTVRAKIASLSALPKGMSAPVPVNPLSLSLVRGEFDQEVFDSLHEKLRGL
jgi:hypothetical protein